MTKREITDTLIICCDGPVLPHGDDIVARGAVVVTIVLYGLGTPEGVIKAKAPDCRESFLRRLSMVLYWCLSRGMA